MSAKHVRQQGEVGASRIMDDRRADFGGASYVVRGDGGYLYLLFHEEDESDIVYSLRELVDGQSPVGPLVSRKRVEWSRLIEQRYEASVESGEELTDDEAYAIVQEAQRAAIAAILDVVGAGERATRRIALVQDAPKRAMTVREALDEAWRDDDWAPTVEEVAERIRSRTGMEVDPATVRRTMSRGPFRSDDRKPARWTRVIGATASGGSGGDE